MTAAASTMTQLVPARLIVGVGSATGGSTGAAATAYQMDVLAKYPEHSGRLLGVIQALGFLARVRVRVRARCSSSGLS